MSASASSSGGSRRLGPGLFGSSAAGGAFGFVGHSEQEGGEGVVAGAARGKGWNVVEWNVVECGNVVECCRNVVA